MGKMLDNFRAWWNSVSDALSDPAKLANLSVADLENNIEKAKAAAAPVIGRPSILKEKIEEAQTQDDDLTKKITALVSQGAEGIEAAKKYAARQVDVRKLLQNLKDDYEDAVETSSAWKEKIQALEAELVKRREKATELSADYAAAKAEQELGKQISSINLESGSDSFSRLEHRVEQEKAKAAGYSAMNGFDDSVKDDEIVKNAEVDALLATYINK